MPRNGAANDVTASVSVTPLNSTSLPSRSTLTANTSPLYFGPRACCTCEKFATGLPSMATTVSPARMPAFSAAEARDTAPISAGAL